MEKYKVAIIDDAEIFQRGPERLDQKICLDHEHISVRKNNFQPYAERNQITYKSVLTKLEDAACAADGNIEK